MLSSSSAKIIDLLNPPEDTISEIAFSTLNSMFITSSWDSSVRLYNPSTSQACLSTITANKPILSCCFSKDNAAQSFAGSADGSLHFIDHEKNTISSMKAHVEGIKSVRYFSNTVITGSWDKTLKFFDTRSGQMTYSISAPGKIYSMDLEGQLLAYGTSNNKIVTVQLDKIENRTEHKSKFSWMIKSIKCGFDGQTVFVGGIEGKCELINVNHTYKNFIFRCHRSGSKVYSVNCVAASPINFNMFATGGSNNEIIFFDSSSRVKSFTYTETNPITASGFSNDGSLFVYGTGNDWSAGYETVYRPVGLKVLQVSSTGLKVGN